MQNDTYAEQLIPPANPHHGPDQADSITSINEMCDNGVADTRKVYISVERVNLDLSPFFVPLPELVLKPDIIHNIWINFRG